MRGAASVPCHVSGANSEMNMNQPRDKDEMTQTGGEVQSSVISLSELAKKEWKIGCKHDILCTNLTPARARLQLLVICIRDHP